jgi:biotin carboxyl carrier protein
VSEEFTIITKDNMITLGETKSVERPPKTRRYLIAIVVSIVFVILLAAVLIFVTVLFPAQKSIITSSGLSPILQDVGRPPTPEEQRASDAINAGANPEDPNLMFLPTPLVAEYNGIKIHSPISVNNMTEVEFHRASNKWTLALKPLLPIVDPETFTSNDRPPAAKQPTGDAVLTANAVSMDRDDSAGVMDSCIDVGAVAGTSVYAPISGTVVLIRPYVLFDEMDDYELHIQQKDHPELDFILLHIEDVTVKPGDEVIAGATRIAQVRNIGEVIDNQLSLFTAGDDPGNHAHLQINDTTYPEYSLLKDALNIFKQ